MSDLKFYLEFVNNSLKDKVFDDIDLSFKKLVELELMFSKALSRERGGKAVYKDFIKFILESPYGITSARPYFRLRESEYKNTINKAIREIDPKALSQYPINFQFCAFVMKNHKTPSQKLLSIFEDLKTIRSEIITRYLYFSLSRSKIFKSINGASRTAADLVDLIQISNEALIVTVDNFVPGDSNFHHVLIGRISADLSRRSDFGAAPTITENDKKKLYRIKKLQQLDSFGREKTAKEIAEALNMHEYDVAALLAASSHAVSISKPEAIEENPDVYQTANEDLESYETGYDQIESSDLYNKLFDSLKDLSIIERKLLRLKGVQNV